MTTTRLLTTADAAELAELERLNTEFLAPWQPVRPSSFHTVEGQRKGIEEVLRYYERGMTIPHVIVDRDRIVGRVTISNIVRYAFQSCNLGYWVAEAENGRGHATAAAAAMIRLAFDDLALHRIEAGALPHNLASQRVLERNGFERFGLAPAYLQIGGRWQDHVLFQLLNPAAG